MNPRPHRLSYAARVKGGHARAHRLSRARRSEIARLGAAERIRKWREQREKEMAETRRVADALRAEDQRITDLARQVRDGISKLRQARIEPEDEERNDTEGND